MTGMVGRTASGKEIAVLVDDAGVVQVATLAAAASTTQTFSDKLDAIQADLDAIKAHLGIT